MKKISASIVIYNNNLKDLISVVNSYAPSESRLLYLIDNSPQRINLEYLNNNKNIIYYFTGKNIGYGSAHNIAIRMAIKDNTQYHIVMNSDIQFESEIIDTIIDFMDSDDSIAQLMPKVLNTKGDIQYLCKLLPVPFDLIFRRFFSDILLFKKINEKYILKESGYNKIINPPCLSGCFMFLRMKIINDNNIYFDERYFLYCEDFDFTRRLHHIAKTIYYPNVSIIHKHAKESYKSNKMFIEHIRSAVKYFNKWGWFLDKERKEMNKKILKEIKK